MRVAPDHPHEGAAVTPTVWYYRARYYDQSNGRFVSEDPIRFRAGVNFYSYVRNRPLDLRDPKGRLAWGGGVTVAGMIGALWFGGGGEGSCLVVGDLEGNSGTLCCVGLGGGAINGAALTGQATSVVCLTCKTICDMEGGFVQVQAFGGLGGAASGGAGASINMTNASIFTSGGVGPGAGGGVAILGGSCKLVWGGKSCKNCPKTK